MSCENVDNCSINKKEKTKLFFKKLLDFLIVTLNGMAYGLFATLIIGTIIATIGGFFKSGTSINKIITEIANCLKLITGAGIGIGIGLALKQDGLKLISIGMVGQLASYLSNDYGFKIGDPLTIYLVVIFTVLLVKLVLRNKTPVDIILVPLYTILVGSILTLILSYPVGLITKGIGNFIGVATSLQPFLMGIIISVVMGMALTAPISSTAIAASIFVLAEDASAEAIAGINLASGAAIVGCCCQMVGFAIMSRKDNSIGMVISIGIGTSMLQFKNILKKPIIWLPTIIVSAILGPIATCVLKVSCMGSSAGMGTAGLVGQFGTYASMGNTLNTWIAILGLEIIAPLILVWILDIIFRKFNLIKENDLKV